jgi:NAD(P)-dependent dehydrogenase (short-subunit alcohol dehydrogenase family)
VEECSAAVVFLASEQASYITGQNYLVNGGAYFH